MLIVGSDSFKAMCTCIPWQMRYCLLVIMQPIACRCKSCTEEQGTQRWFHILHESMNAAALFDSRQAVNLCLCTSTSEGTVHSVFAMLGVVVYLNGSGAQQEGCTWAMGGRRPCSSGPDGAFTSEELPARRTTVLCGELCTASHIKQANLAAPHCHLKPTSSPQ